MSWRDWESSFLAVSALLGEPLDASLSAAGDATTAEARELLRSLRAPSRDMRSRAIARALSRAAADVDAARLG
jgi:hypothetical protein